MTWQYPEVAVFAGQLQLVDVLVSDCSFRSDELQPEMRGNRRHRQDLAARSSTSSIVPAR